jgi:hypothetical protein
VHGTGTKNFPSFYTYLAIRKKITALCLENLSHNYFCNLSVFDNATSALLMYDKFLLKRPVCVCVCIYIHICMCVCVCLCVIVFVFTQPTTIFTLYCMV